MSYEFSVDNDVERQEGREDRRKVANGWKNPNGRKGKDFQRSQRRNKRASKRAWLDS